MEKNLLNHYSVKRLESIAKHLSTYAYDKKPEHLHRLRVDIKKIKAIISFAENVYKEKHDFAKLKPLFRDAGKVREMQINIRVLSSTANHPTKLIYKLQKKEAILVKNLLRNASKYIILIMDFRTKISLPETVPSKKRINKYFQKETRKAHKILLVKDRECMHRYRMKIKKLMYIYSVLPKNIQNEMELNVAEIKKQEEKLGNWHDIYSATKFLSAQHFPMKEIENSLVTKEKKQFEALYTNLMKNVSDKAT